MGAKKLFILIIFISFSFNFIGTQPCRADTKIPQVTKWSDPLSISKPLHDQQSVQQPLVIKEATTMIKKGIPLSKATTNNKRICIVVHQDIYDNISSNLSQYREDLNAMGYTILIKIFVSGTPEDLRDYLYSLYQTPESLNGAILIGNIPYIIYEVTEDWGNGYEYEDFPCDLFYMDLDGTWSDSLDNGSVSSDNGKYDTRNGDLSLEIWVSRIKTDNLPSLGSETDIINKYFEKNHNYRNGLLQSENKALIYNDDDWSDMAQSDMQSLERLYNAENITSVSASEETTAYDYKNNQLKTDYELISVRSHGNSKGHEFYRKDKSISEYIYSDEYDELDPCALFYSLFVCSAADYTVDDNLAGTIAFNNNDSGLLVWSSTKKGGMWSEQAFYTSLNNGLTFGESFKSWFNKVQAIYPDYAPQYWYGMTLIGDGSLIHRKHLPVEPDSTSATQQTDNVSVDENNITIENTEHTGNSSGDEATQDGGGSGGGCFITSVDNHSCMISYIICIFLSCVILPLHCFRNKLARY